MVVIAVLLIAIAVAVAVIVLTQATEPAPLEFFGVTLDTSEAGVFVVGAATMLVLLLGISLLVGSGARAKRRRDQSKAAERERRSEVARLEREKAELEERLAREREAETRYEVAPGSTAVDETRPIDLRHGQREPRA